MDAFETIISEQYTQDELDNTVITVTAEAAAEMVNSDIYVKFGQFPQTWTR